MLAFLVTAYVTVSAFQHLCSKCWSWHRGGIRVDSWDEAEADWVIPFPVRMTFVIESPAPPNNLFSSVFNFPSHSCGTKPVSSPFSLCKQLFPPKEVIFPKAHQLQADENPRGPSPAPCSTWSWGCRISSTSALTSCVALGKCLGFSPDP